jgi:hypothetical protein
MTSLPPHLRHLPHPPVLTVGDLFHSLDDVQPVAIPGKIIRFLEQYANLAFAGSCDRNLVPHGHRVSGWRVGADGRTLTALVTEGFTAGLVETLADNVRPLYVDAPDQLLQAYITDPELAVEFDVREVYLQTPGPGAGTRLVPPVQR